ncbi:MAG: 1-acyl-sn-glycerol-3-phosphate acyltransferase [Peptococcaceae bacterium]|nr:1-acyl-sn-glycerol-3-phosphate acyltransferase [Peptococcaceae bacterium]
MFYRFAWLVCRAVLLSLRRMEIRGLENIPMQGAFVLVCNHKSYWDPVIIGCALPMTRQVFFMAKSELFDIVPLGLIIRKLGSFPIRRGGADRAAIRTALDHLAAGRIVGIFPEGTRNKSDGILEPHLGAAMLATRAGVPVLPAAVSGSRGFWSKVRIVFGEPVHFHRETAGNKVKKANRKELADISEDIMNRVAGLMEVGSGMREVGC